MMTWGRKKAWSNAKYLDILATNLVAIDLLNSEIYVFIQTDKRKWFVK